MTRTPKGWIARLSAVTTGLSRKESARLRDRLQDAPTDRRAALGLRIALLRQDLIRGSLPPAPAPEKAPVVEILAPTVTTQSAPEPGLTLSVVEPAAPVPARSKKKKVNFAAVSLDDAASLLSAFGGSGDPPAGNTQETPPDPAAERAELLQDVDAFVPVPPEKPTNG